jgi:hypothetical protein
MTSLISRVHKRNRRRDTDGHKPCETTGLLSHCSSLSLTTLSVSPANSLPINSCLCNTKAATRCMQAVETSF